MASEAGSSSATIINKGTIQADVNGGGITIDPEFFTNQGTVALLNGGTLYVVPTGSSTDWTNTGTFSVGNYSNLYLYGTVTTAGLGTITHGTTGTSIFLGGTINNTNANLTLDGSANSSGTIILRARG